MFVYLIELVNVGLDVLGLLDEVDVRPVVAVLYLGPRRKKIL